MGHDMTQYNDEGVFAPPGDHVVHVVSIKRGRTRSGTPFIVLHCADREHRVIRAQWWTTPKALPRFRRALETMGFTPAELKAFDADAMLPGRTFVARVRDRDGYHEVSAVFPITADSRTAAAAAAAATNPPPVGARAPVAEPDPEPEDFGGPTEGDFPF